jgi:succinyl-diaminopimelate desuccinylase
MTNEHIPAIKPMLASLVAMQTLSNDAAACREAVTWIRAQFKGLPLYISEFGFAGHPALVATTRKTKRPKVMLHAHLDIAHAPEELFTMREKDGLYLGRGVFDMKYAVASYIHLLRSLGQDLPSFDLGVTFSTDEESTGGMDGVAKLTAAGWGGDIVIDPDAIGDWHIERAVKGIIRFRIKSHGEAGHGSRPWLYRNAITQLTNYLGRVASTFPTEPCGDEEHAHATFNIGIIHGGQMANQVAGDAYADVDIRRMPDQSLAEMEALLRNNIKSQDDIEFEVIALGDAVEIDPANEHLVLLKSIIKQATGVDSKLILSHGSSEAPHYAANGMPVILFGPPGGGHHSDREWISVEGIDQFYQIIHKFVIKTAKVPDAKLSKL